RQTIRGGWVGPAHQDAETVAAQMTRLEFVAVPAHAQHAEAVAVEVGQARFDEGRDGYHLPGDGVPILEPGGADFLRRYLQSTGDLTDEELRAQAAFFHPEVEEISLT